MRSLLLPCIALAFGLLLSPPAPAAVQVDGFTHVKSLDGIDEYKLDANGLGVLLLPSHAAPVVTFDVTYKVGSRNEVTGITGSAHLLEHLMFKGSKKYHGANGIDVQLEAVGAINNASTWYDETSYYATLGREDLEMYVKISADRMRNLLLLEKDRQSEMPVVRNEYERGENDPNSNLNKQVWAAAYQAYPYHHPVIGWRSDIENVSIEKLRAFYDTYYWPNNAVVVVVGDFEPARVLHLIKQYYGDIPHSPRPIPVVYTKEPPQQGPRRVVLERAGETGTVMIAWKGPSATDADSAPLTVLGLVLSHGKSSRLSRALVDSSQASYVGASMVKLYAPGLFTATAALTEDAKQADVEKTMLAEITRIQREGVSAQEIERALGPYRAQQAYLRDGTGNAASALGSYVGMGDWTLYATFLDKLEKVTPADVKRVANTWLKQDQSTTGWFVPEKAQ